MRILDGISIKIKMAIIGFITLVSLVIISVLFLIQEQQTMLNEKKTKLINLVEVSYITPPIK